MKNKLSRHYTRKAKPTLRRSGFASGECGVNDYIGHIAGVDK